MLRLAEEGGQRKGFREAECSVTVKANHNGNDIECVLTGLVMPSDPPTLSLFTFILVTFRIDVYSQLTDGDTETQAGHTGDSKSLEMAEPELEQEPSTCPCLACCFLQPQL